jgi:hypothetical protein
MATNREMLKEAIAEAKAVKEMAIANAKAALEEAFTPQLKSMLSMKLQEMELEEEDIYEYSEEHEDPTTGKRVTTSDVTEDDNMNEIDLEELLAELEKEEMDENLNEAEEGEEEGEEEEGGEEGEPLDLEDMTDEDLKKMIEDVIASMVSSGELEAGHEGGEEEEGEEMKMSDEEEVDLAELLREIDEMEKNEVYEEETTGETSPENKEIEAAFTKVNENLLKEEAFPSGPELAAILSGIAAIIGSGVGYVNLRAYAERKAKAGSKKWQKILDVANKLGAGAGSATRVEENEEELEEAYAAIETLKEELNTINLLNAKLLYTNKIFKAKNLNESQKVKVLSSFDKAKNVGEVKMVFETLNEGIKVAKTTIKENLGRASKGTIAPTKKQSIVESNDVFKRMQKLAGII